MMPPRRIAPTKNTPPQETTVPVIELSLVNLTVGRAPADPSINAFFIGPVILQVPFDDAAKKQVVQALTGIELPPAVRGI